MQTYHNHVRLLLFNIFKYKIRIIIDNEIKMLINIFRMKWNLGNYQN